MSDEFDIASLDSADEATMVVLNDGKPTSWVWTFAGPGHARTVALSERLARESLEAQRAQELARVNGRKWKPEDKSPAEVLQKNVKLVTDRLLNWSAVKFNGEPFPCTEENATRLLMDPRKAGLLKQALDFLADESSFTQRSLPL